MDRVLAECDDCYAVVYEDKMWDHKNQWHYNLDEMLRAALTRDDDA